MLGPLLVVLAGIVTSYAQLTSSWNSYDFERIQSRSAEIIRSSQSSKDVYYSLQLLGHLDKENRDKFCSCDNINKVKSNSNVLELAYGIRAGNICGCDSKINADQASLLQKSFDSDVVEDVIGALYASASLNSLSEETQENAVLKLRKLLTVDNEIQLFDVENPQGSLLRARQILDTLAELSRTNPAVSALTNDIYEKAFQLVPNGNHDVFTDVTILAGLSKLSENEKVKLSPTNLAESSDALLALRHSEDPYTLHQAIEASTLLSRNKKSPVYIEVQSSKFQVDSPSTHTLEYTAKNILGKELKIESIEVLFVKTVGKDQSFLQNENIEGNRIDLSSLQLTAGRYHVSISVGIKNKPTRIPIQSYFIVTESAQIVEVNAAITSSAQVTTSDWTGVTTQNSFHGDGNAAAGHVFHVNFQVTSSTGKSKIRKPHQSIVRLTEEVSGQSVYFVASKNTGDSQHEYTLAVPLVDEVEKFAYTSGTWIITILIADTTYTTPLEFVVGSVDLKFPSKPTPTYPLYAKALLHTSDITLKALPEIEHQMRPPAKRASDFMAAVFTAIVLVPLVVFVGYIISLKPNLARFNSLSTVAFLVAMIALIGLYLSYWFAIDGVTFYKTIQYLCILFPVIIFLGSYALSSVMETRLKQK